MDRLRKKNLTKAEVEQRKAQEIKEANDKVKPPSYLPKDLKKEFKKIASELLHIGIMNNLDVDALARFLCARKMCRSLARSKRDSSVGIIAIAHMLDTALGDQHMSNSATIFFYMANELLSILENAGRIGLPVPDVVKRVVEVLKRKG
ncbi:phage holin family protein [Brevibacillus laterosporus]|uniref:phage holin family protein n=1 Tax=Brevibacillus laterosporus TaxID=1465 RepID=UPI00399D0DDA